MMYTMRGGIIRLNDYTFSSTNYNPPQYQRATSYADAPLSTPDGIVMLRNVTDQGPLPGVWQQFTIQCYAADELTPALLEPFRGDYVLNCLLELFSYINTPMVLLEIPSNRRYRVQFAADGLTIQFAQGVAKGGVNPQTGEEVGPEYEVQVGLIEVPAAPGETW